MSGNGQEVENETKVETEPEAPASEAAEAEVPVDLEKVQLQGRILELEARLRTVSAAFKEKQDEINATKERLVRQAQIEDEIRRGEVVTTLFEPVENLHRSIQAGRNLPDDMTAGLKMVHGEFMAALKKLGLEEVAGVGSAFDPTVHEAIATMPTSDKAQDNQVAQVYSSGYRIGKRLVRAARVVIYSHQDA